MKKPLQLLLTFATLCTSYVSAQEASSGLDLRATLTGQFAASNILTHPPRFGAVAGTGFRGVIYPAWKMSDHWTATAAWQLATRPYFYQSFSTAGIGANGSLLQASLNYARVSEKGSVLLRAGELSSAFGSFLLRYDDADNALIDMPLEYGYYYAPVSFLSVAGAHVDATRGKWDGRVQFANSSPENPRSIFDHDQYGNWAGGGGFTVRQGFRVGGSAYRGPYLDRQYKFFHAGEANPNTLPGSGVGLDASLTRGHWNLQGEWQRFVFSYTVTPTVHEEAGYAEFKRVVAPRWSIAARGGATNSNIAGQVQSYEGMAGFRPNRFQLIKVGYEFKHVSSGTYRNDNILAIQFVTTFHTALAGH